MHFDDPTKASLMHRAGDILIPKIKFVEPLSVARHFIQCIENNEQPLTDTQHARMVVDCLAKADACLKKVMK